ncbi:MAG: energy transducer TonB [Candidatus Sulfotelmatobacter sp.]
MKWALASFLIVFLVCSFAFSQDIKVREEAVLLLERAQQVSRAAKLPNLERVDSFRTFGDAGIKEGSFSRIVIQGVGRRDEYSFGDYRLVNVWTQKQVAVTGSPHVMPGELVNVGKLTPILLVHFDGEDVIHSISQRNLGGHNARCIEFDTIRGQRTQNNELCVDSDTGVLLEEKLGEELVENSDFFPFAGALMPAKISYSVAGTRKLEISQFMKALSDGETNVLSAPPGAEVQKRCTTFRGPFGTSMPQPKAGNGGSDVDIVVHAMILPNGRVYEASIQNSERPDLNDEALTTVKQWTFTPAMCDGNPKELEVSLAVHFQGR